MGNPKIGQQTVAALIQQDVGGLDIPVHHTVGMGIIQRLAHLADHLHDLLPGQGLAAQPGGQGAAGNQRHDDKWVAFFLAVIEHRQDEGMLECGEQAGLAAKTPVEVFVCRKLARQHLDRHESVGRGLVGFEDGRHAALTQRLDDTISGELGTD